MYFFAEASTLVTQSTPIGNWDVAGYQQINVHAWIKGGPGKVFMETYFNNLSAAQEVLTIGPPGPGGWNIAIFTKTYPVYAPKLSVVLYNPTTQMDFTIRLYAACCESRVNRLAKTTSRSRQLSGNDLAAEAGQPYRTLKTEIDLNSLMRPVRKR